MIPTSFTLFCSQIIPYCAFPVPSIELPTRR
jgi:hypothetical protein